MSETEQRLLGVKEVALRLRCSPKTVYRKVSSGELPAVKLGSGPKAPIRVDAGELDAWIYHPAGVSPSFRPPREAPGGSAFAHGAGPPGRTKEEA
jgi:excisionase family DNA binding protein